MDNVDVIALGETFGSRDKKKNRTVSTNTNSLKLNFLQRGHVAQHSRLVQGRTTQVNHILHALQQPFSGSNWMLIALMALPGRGARVAPC